MFVLSCTLFLAGLYLAGFNGQIAARFCRRRQNLYEEFYTSVTRQNIAGVGAALIFGSLMVVWMLLD
jgi:hypothetical protein